MALMQKLRPFLPSGALSSRRSDVSPAPAGGQTVGMSVREKRKFETVDHRQLDHLRVFHDVARALTSNLELEPLLRAIMSQMEDFFGPEQWSLLMVDEETQELYYALSVGVDDSQFRGVRIARGQGIAGWVAASGNALVVPDVSKDADWSRFAAAHPELNMHSIACLPIRHGDRTLGVLQLNNSHLDRLPDNAISFLRVLCDYAAIGLENARQVKLIHHLSITDDCTGLFNARYLYTLLEQEIAAARSPHVVPIKQHFSLVFFDLDRFKSVNDTHGHLVGSRLLQEVGGVIKRTIGPDHAGFRYGGDEFVLLLRGLDKPEATALAHTLRDTLNATDFLTGAAMTLKLTASFGLATFPQDGPDMHGIIRASDTMMYVAKAQGRDCVAVADTSQPMPMPPPKNSRHS
ncbi:diguanylate cyclase with GAF sensor [Bryocella elongata]|uniref:diguanylate cyclase n=2 Tax=Bryocella elongata TaxID=863522 RepID=A0A1H5YP96_9BACT|nr:diguanylate cyclase with GAF sensor [Bryocella elongata]